MNPDTGNRVNASVASGDGAPLLRVANLVVAFGTEFGELRAVDDVSFSVKKGRILGIVGESGCGKSVTALSIMRLLPQPAGRILSGRIMLGQTDICRMPAERLHEIRGRRIAMIFQEPMTALNPVHRIGRQIAEVFHLHFPQMDATAIEAAAQKLLARVGIPDPKERIHAYPHQISGGMRQRVMIAMALAGQPEILIADEPTTALDVTIQRQILTEIRQLQRKSGMAVIFITHDLGVIAEMCDAVAVMYAGKIAESASVKTLFLCPAHPYTMGLLAAIPRLEHPRKQRLPVIRGMVPGLEEMPDGCRFQNRCPYAMAICEIQAPPLVRIDDGHQVACWLYR